jgi:hypothetical protein
METIMEISVITLLVLMIVIAFTLGLCLGAIIVLSYYKRFGKDIDDDSNSN